MKLGNLGDYFVLSGYRKETLFSDFSGTVFLGLVFC